MAIDRQMRWQSSHALMQDCIAGSIAVGFFIGDPSHRTPVPGGHSRVGMSILARRGEARYARCVPSLRSPEGIGHAGLLAPDQAADRKRSPAAGATAAGLFRIGRRTVNRVPTPTSLSTSIWPPCLSTIA